MRAVVTDIEGTTTSLSLVREVLFPYARARLADFLRRHREDAEVKAILDDIRARENDASLGEDSIVALLHRWMDEDRKTAPLKSLQGLIWREGYAAGELHGHLYEDARDQLRRWHAAGVRLYVYSSGSVAAQRLLFGNTPFGDLTGLFSGYFDTAIGGKLDPRSYEAIARAIEFAPEHILFLSDHRGELDAARAAGLSTVWVERDGRDVAVADSPHRRVSSFAEIRVDEGAGNA
ncbi:MAG: acireductone synthase [Polyangiaceae bacterium]